MSDLLDLLDDMAVATGEKLSIGRTEMGRARCVRCGEGITWPEIGRYASTIVCLPYWDDICGSIRSHLHHLDVCEQKLAGTWESPIAPGDNCHAPGHNHGNANWFPKGTPRACIEAERDYHREWLLTRGIEA